MGFVQIVNPADLRRLRYLVWCDPAADDLLRALSKCKRVCPVIETARKRIRRDSV